MATSQPPADIGLVLDFLNTLDLEGGDEEFDTPERLAAWLRARSLLPDGARVTAADLARAREVREAVREVLWAHTHRQAPPDESVAALNRALRRVRSRLAFDAGGQAALGLEGAPVDVALASVLEALRRVQESGAAERLKVCRSDTCRWAYYDASKNRSRAWCDMTTCGSRMKARAYRRRKRER